MTTFNTSYASSAGASSLYALNTNHTAMPANLAALQELWQWAQNGLLQRLDAAFAQWLLIQDSTTEPKLLYLAAVLSHMERHNHTCLQINNLSLALPNLLGWSSDIYAQEALKILREKIPQSVHECLSLAKENRLFEVIDHHNKQNDITQPQDNTTAPLVLEMRNTELRLYLRRYHTYERRTAYALQQLILRLRTFSNHAIAMQLQRFFPQENEMKADINWQKIACALALRCQFCVITGGPGTGKTYTAARLMAIIFALAEDPSQVRIQLAAPTGKAAARLTESLHQARQELKDIIANDHALLKALHDIPNARTLSSLLKISTETGQSQHNAAKPLSVDWLIVDETSMVHLGMMDTLLQSLPAHAHLVLLGDKDQLASVGAGSVLADICFKTEKGHYNHATCAFLRSTTKIDMPKALHLSQHDNDRTDFSLTQCTVMLRSSRRFQGNILQLAQAVQQNSSETMQAILANLRASNESERDIFWLEGSGALKQAKNRIWQAQHSALCGYQAFAEILKKMPNKHTEAQSLSQQAQHQKWVQEVLSAANNFRILCATREGPWGVAAMNHLVMDVFDKNNIAVRRSGWFAGRIVMVTRNNASLKIFNGEVGVALPTSNARNAPLRVYFKGTDTDLTRSISISQLQHTETAFAMTVHKSQGSEFSHVMLLLPDYFSPVLSRELLYTGLTRAKKGFSYLCPAQGMWQRVMAQPTYRASGLSQRLHSKS